MMRGLMIAAPASGSGKTFITLGILRALKDRFDASNGSGSAPAIASAKSGPDYIDPQFHHRALGQPCINLDTFAMSSSQILPRAWQSGADLFIVEGAMGLFDGAIVTTQRDNAGIDLPPRQVNGSAATLCKILTLPVILVLDVARQAQTAAAILHGLSHFDDGVKIGGVILNQVGSKRHERMITEAISPLNIPVLGAIPRLRDLHLPSRHLGLVQADELNDLEAFIAQAANEILTHIDLDQLISLAETITPLEGVAGAYRPHPPLGQNIAIAKDEAFSFVYHHMLEDWQSRGASLSFFSPLANEAPPPEADAIFLPGGYPELHAEKLSCCANFKAGMHRAAHANVLIYGECGGFMVLGNAVVDANGKPHSMLELLPLMTSFADRKLQLGYRQLTSLYDDFPWHGHIMAHEFHYATIVEEGQADRLFEARDAAGNRLSPMGMRINRVMGSYAHIID